MADSPIQPFETQTSHQAEEPIDKPSTELPSHSDIMNRYKRLMSSQKENNKHTEDEPLANEDVMSVEQKEDECAIKDEPLVVETISQKQDPVSACKLMEIDQRCLFHLFYFKPCYF